jgi:acyl-CoA thioesterase-1
MVKAVLQYVPIVLLVPLLGGCNPERPPNESAAEKTPVAVVPATEADQRPVVLFLGTSLTAGYGLDPSYAYPALIQTKIDSAGLEYQVVNAGVSGQTSAGTRNSLTWQLRRPVAVLVVETGGNDGLRGIDPAELRKNLEAVILRAKEQQPPPVVILAGMEAPPNLGRVYTGQFRDVYSDLARQYDLPLVPFLLDGVGGIDSLNQSDGIHPTARGQQLLADNVWRVLQPKL